MFCTMLFFNDLAYKGSWCGHLYFSIEELLSRSRDQFVSDYGKRTFAPNFALVFILFKVPDNVSMVVVMFFRFVTSGEIRKRAEFFEPFIAGLTNTSVDQVSCAFTKLISMLPFCLPI